MFLNSFVGQRVIVVLAAGNAWLSCHVSKGEITLSMVENEQGRLGFVPSPFLIGNVVEKDGEYMLEIRDPNNVKLLVAVNPDHIATVTMMVEERILRASGLVTP